MQKLRQLGMMSIVSTPALAQDMSKGADNFYKSKEVTMQNVTFKNQYNMKVVGNLFTPKDFNKNTKNPAIIVGHPMGAGCRKGTECKSVCH
jgi:hypothetical protein